MHKVLIKLVDTIVSKLVFRTTPGFQESYINIYIRVIYKYIWMKMKQEERNFEKLEKEEIKYTKERREEREV